MITGIDEKAAEEKKTEPAAEPKNGDATKAKAPAATDVKPVEKATIKKADAEPEKTEKTETAKATTEAPPASEPAKAADAPAHSAPTIAATRGELKELLDEAREATDGGKEETAPKVEPAEAHVLVVEDNVPNFVLIARLLAYMGVQRCEWKTSGWQVVEFADTLPRIDLVLMDIQLPYEDGFQALQKLRGHPRLKNTLVVAVTANSSVEQLNKAKASGFDGFLAKPLDPDKFPEQIKRVLNGEEVWEL